MATIEIPAFVVGIVREFDMSESAVGEWEVCEALRLADCQDALEDQSVRDGWFAEVSAFRFSASRRPREPSVWGTFFGPTGSMPGEDGATLHFPDLKKINADFVKHWETRAHAATHPVLKARYADLVWDLKRRVTRVAPEPTYAQVAVRAYTDAVSRQLYKREINGVRYVERALDIAVSLNDQSLIAETKDVAFVLHRDLRDSRRPGYAFFLFDLFFDEFRKKVSLDEAEATEIVNNLEEALRVWITPNKDHFDPHAAKNAAKRLIGFYRRKARQGEIERVARAAGGALEAFASMGDAILGTTTLQDAHRFYQEAGLRGEADRALREASRRGDGIEESMMTFSTVFEINKEAVDKAVDEILTGDRGEVVARIADNFVPSADAVKADIEELRRDFPLLAHLPTVTTDGLARAHVGGVVDDPDGRLVQGLTERLAMQAPLLGGVLQAFVERNGLTAEVLCEIVSESPVFAADRRNTFQRGVERYLAGDWISTIHVLVPFLEQSVRRLLGALGGLTDKREGNVYMARDLGAVLGDPLLKSFWEHAGLPDVPLYLRALMTDQRGWNIRNRVAHGLCEDTFFGQQIADRVVHVVLLLSLVRSAP